MKLTSDEIFAIRWHMGFSEEKSLHGTLDDAMSLHPLVLAVYEADMEASKLLEA